MSNWIKAGIPVVNISNLDIVFTVEKIIFKSKKIVIDDVPKRVNKIQGIEVKRITSEGIEKQIMHSKELIPFSVAQKGKLEAYKFINREDIYKDY